MIPITSLPWLRRAPIRKTVMARITTMKKRNLHPDEVQRKAAVAMVMTTSLRGAGVKHPGPTSSTFVV
jgi:hypothetical protein